ncbi:hypothetical protein A3D54_00640 [Candidatus Falkowbacteria bacterium RIFCSPHIGHO2_02_FULL_45_15]|uniref:Nitroreductase domain-containing protein n=1 Tax=Candidatus Falkowbacteria bacterium RIFCSPHIGHO2_02_FULL_45_15 TaxID=1797987 RepID=A0A1F5RZS9_9BACT|nr:MAG: hypothetical protein A3D54_00640 [Candidatus Falkowbacteria bacterium RIFCSPHIGHO2_02_FULL_45_15]
MIAKTRQSDYFLRLAKSRKTTYEFSDKKVEDSDLKKVLEAARWSPSCSNAQPWHFIVVRDKEKIAELMKTASYGAFHSDPPLLIASVLDFECWECSEHRCVKNTKLGTVEAYLCIAMPTLSICFEALELGINSCILTPEIKSASKILKLREGDAIPILIGLGYEKKGAFQKPRTRKDLKKLVSGEYFGGKIRL